MNKAFIEDSFLRLHSYIQRCEYKGYEFDDFLVSPIIRKLTLDNLFFQRAAIQIGKRCPINVRPLIGVKKLNSTKARGFFARGYLYYFLLNENPRWLNRALESLNWLQIHHSRGFSGISWGNDFDFASGAGFFPRGLPTVVWTSLIAATFEMAYVITKHDTYLQALKKSADFIVSNFEYYQDDDGICFFYAPGIRRLIHNANLLGASTLLRAWKYIKNSTYYNLSKSAFHWTIAHQNRNGSWYYGEGKGYRLRNWIDNFHTAYNIDSLGVGYEIGGEEIVPFSKLKKAYDYWTLNFFFNDGRPKYYHNRLYPIDIQCASQAIETLSKLVTRYFPEGLELCEKILLWTVQNMQKTNGAFVYQRRRFWVNKLESLHWGQSTMLAALGAYLFYSSGRQNKYNIPYI